MKGELAFSKGLINKKTYKTIIKLFDTKPIKLVLMKFCKALNFSKR